MRKLIILTIALTILMTGCMTVNRTENMTDQEIVEMYCEIENVKLISEIEIDKFDSGNGELKDYYQFKVLNDNDLELVYYLDANHVNRVVSDSM